MLLFGAGFCLSPSIAKPARHLFSARVNAYGKMVEPLWYCKCDGKVTFTRGKVTFDEHVNALERYWKGDIMYTLTKPKWLSFQR